MLERYTLRRNRVPDPRAPVRTAAYSNCRVFSSRQELGWLMPGAQYCTGIGQRKVHHSPWL
jgi:hypothetical protein